MVLGQLQAFLEIARLGNVTRAADTLFLTQPALTSRLKRLEEEIGATLLVRDRKGARLTDAGRAFLPYAERAVAVMTEAQRVVTDVTHGAQGELNVAATATFSMYVLPKVIQRFAVENPAVRLGFHSTASEEILDLVVRGEVHLGLARLIQHPEVEATPLYDEEYLLVVDAKHPLARAGKVNLAQFAGETLLTLSRSPSIREFLDVVLRNSPQPPRNIVDVDNSEAGKRTLGPNFGIGLVPRTAVEGELAAGTLCRIDPVELPPMRRTMAVMRRRGASELTAAQDFVALVRAELRAMNLTRGVKRSPRTRVRSLSRR